MSTIQDVRSQLATLVTEAHRVACSLDVGEERTEAFELYEALRRLQRQGSAGEMLQRPTPSSHRHITTAIGMMMTTNDATDSQL